MAELDTVSFVHPLVSGDANEHDDHSRTSARIEADGRGNMAKFARGARSGEWWVDGAGGTATPSATTSSTSHKPPTNKTRIQITTIIKKRSKSPKISAQNKKQR